MRIRVETRADSQGTDAPWRIDFDGRHVDVAETLDRWHGADYRYFKVKGEDGNLYILYFDETRGAWEMTMFRSAEAETSPSIRL